MKWTAIVAGVLMSGASSVVAAQSLASLSHYNVEWREAEFPVARVKAAVPSKDCTFGTSRKWSTFFEGDAGWSRFVRDLRAVDGRGRTLPVKPLPEGRWKVGEGSGPCRVNLTYSVDFSFARESWSAGNEQVAYMTDRGLYSTGLPLFIHGDATAADVKIEIPPAWEFAAPWQPISNGRFRASSQDALLENTFVVGKDVVQTFRAGAFMVDIGLLGHPPSSASIFAATFSKLAPRLVDLFGDRRAGRYMIVLLNGPEDGESFENSFAVATAAAPADSNRLIWANHLSHELIHYWIGKAIAPSSDAQARFKWFTEGFTEYLANRELLEAGIYTRGDFSERMSRHFGNYLLTRQNPLFRKVGLRDAGEQGWQNRPIIYSGGATLAACLDGQIRESSGGSKSLTDLVRRLFARSQSGEAFSQEMFVEEASAATGKPMQSFYDDHVVGNRVLPIEECAKSLGMTALVQGYEVFVMD